MEMDGLACLRTLCSMVSEPTESREARPYPLRSYIRKTLSKREGENRKKYKSQKRKSLCLRIWNE